MMKMPWTNLKWLADKKTLYLYLWNIIIEICIYKLGPAWCQMMQLVIQLKDIKPDNKI